MTSIAEERRRLADLGASLILRETWGSRFNYGNSRTVVEPARQQFVHITVTNPNAYRSHAAHVLAIESIGRRRFPNTGISYNRIIVFGVQTAFEAQPIGRRGAHTVNDFGYSSCRRWGGQCPGRGGSFFTAGHGTNLNYSARAYAYGALCEASAPNSVIDTLARTMAADRLAGFVRMDAEIHGHRCVSAKSCPCQGIWSQMHELEQKIQNYLEEEEMPTAKEIAEATVSELLHHKIKFPEWTGPDGADLYEPGTAFPVYSLLAGGYAHAKLNGNRSLSIIDMLKAQEPLLEAAAKGEGLTSEQVAEIAQAISDAVPASLSAQVADEVADELADRMTD